jgi:predicted SAM-dependent methyltransferase
VFWPGHTTLPGRVIARTPETATSRLPPSVVPVSNESKCDQGSIASSHQPSILRYARDLRRWELPPNERPVSALDTSPVVKSGPVKRFLRASLPGPVLNHGQVLATRMVMPLTARWLVRKTGSNDTETRLQFGCGSRRLSGWVNIDLLGSSADFVWDLRRPVPLPNNSVSAVYHEHFLEHLPFDSAVQSLQDAYRLLRPGGILRLAVPDFRRYCEDYVEPNGFLDLLKPDRPTRCIAVNEILYWYGHRSMWDAETLTLLLTELGFDGVRQCRFEESAIEPCPDWDAHENETLYVEGRKAT